MRQNTSPHGAGESLASRLGVPAPVALPLAIAAAYGLAFLWIALNRLSFPSEIEWMEGGMVAHAARLLLGEPIYAEPSVDFVPFFYTPGYPALLAALSKLTGSLTIPLGRAVSLISTLITMGLITFTLRRERCSWPLALLGPLFYAALFRTCGAFYDLARPDSLALMLTLAMIIMVRFGRGRWALCGAALLCVAAFLSKQTSAVFFPPLVLALLPRQPGRAISFALLSVLLSVSAVYMINRATDGAFWAYIFEGHQGHVFYWKNILLKYWRDLIFLAPIVLLLPLLWFSELSWVRRLPLLLAAWWAYAFTQRVMSLDYRPHMYYRELFYESPRWLILVPPLLIAGLLLAAKRSTRAQSYPETSGFWLWIYIAGVGASGLNHSTQWAYSNCFMPLALCVSLFIPQLTRDLMRGGTARRWLVSAALSVQLIAWGYAPAAQIPSPESEAAYEEVITQLDRLSGPKRPIFSPAHPLYSWRLRGQVFTHQMGIQDVKYRGGLPDLRPRLRAHEWGAILLESRNTIPHLDAHYFKAAELHWPSPHTLQTRTGFLVRPASIWLPSTEEERALSGTISGAFESKSYLGWESEGGFGAAPQRRKQRGMQGRGYAASDRAGGLRAVGRLRSGPLRLPSGAQRISFLAQQRGKGGALLTVELFRARDGARIARRSIRRREWARHTLTLPSQGEGELYLELRDQATRGALWVDDLRFE